MAKTYRDVAQFPSSSSSKVYTVKEDETGELSCDCRGWTMKKPGQERSCKHTRELVAHGAPTVPVQWSPSQRTREPESFTDEPKGSADEPEDSGPEGEIDDLMAGINAHRDETAGLSLGEKMRLMKEAEGG